MNFKIIFLITIIITHVLCNDHELNRAVELAHQLEVYGFDSLNSENIINEFMKISNDAPHIRDHLRNMDYFTMANLLLPSHNFKEYNIDNLLYPTSQGRISFYQ